MTTETTRPVPQGVSGLEAALANAHAFTQESVDRLRNGNKSVSEAA